MPRKVSAVNPRLPWLAPVKLRMPPLQGLSPCALPRMGGRIMKRERLTVEQDAIARPVSERYDVGPVIACRHLFSSVNHTYALRAARIEWEEIGRGERQAVAGFDLTFSPVKSVSTAWALASPEVAAELDRAQHDAVAVVLGRVETDVAATRRRTGSRTPTWPGIVVASFDHRTSRAGDPDLHTHAVVSNKVLGVDGEWRSLDSKAMFRAAVSLLCGAVCQGAG